MPDKDGKNLTALEEALNAFTKETAALKGEHKKNIGDILKEIHGAKLENLKRRIKNN